MNVFSSLLSPLRYWGDFFFLRTGSRMLSFDGVFELVPHPMYTIGYGWTYGCAILARSSTVLAVGMAFHLSQVRTRLD